MPQSPNRWSREFDANPLGLVRVVVFWVGAVGFALALLVGVLRGEASPWRALAFLSACGVGVALIGRMSRTKVGGMAMALLTLIAMAIGAFLRLRAS
jgi:hypothetical protein